jgi:hypothetical protein
MKDTRVFSLSEQWFSWRMIQGPVFSAILLLSFITSWLDDWGGVSLSFAILTAIAYVASIIHSAYDERKMYLEYKDDFLKVNHDGMNLFGKIISWDTVRRVSLEKKHIAVELKKPNLFPVFRLQHLLRVGREKRPVDYWNGDKMIYLTSGLFTIPIHEVYEAIDGYLPDEEIVEVSPTSLKNRKAKSVWTVVALLILIVFFSFITLSAFYFGERTLGVFAIISLVITSIVFVVTIRKYLIVHV